jgi:hypothetical protein
VTKTVILIFRVIGCYCEKIHGRFNALPDLWTAVSLNKTLPACVIPYFPSDYPVLVCKCLISRLSLLIRIGGIQQAGCQCFWLVQIFYCAGGTKEGSSTLTLGFELRVLWSRAIAGIAIQDLGLTAKMLQVADFAAFGLAHQVSSPFNAVQFISLNAVRSIALAAHVFSDFEQAEIKKFSAGRV